jgi:sarcosine oxidase subunit gamma
MSETTARCSPLARVLGAPVAGIGERAFEGQINLRGEATDPRFVEAVRRVTGIAPPDSPNTLARAGARQLAWLGPDEWLLTTPPGEEGSMLAALDAALAGLHAGATDLSEGYTVIVLDGADAEEILACECPLDLQALDVGHCAQTLVGKSNVLIVRETPERFALVVRRSFAEYLYALLGHLAALVRAAQPLPA